MWWQLFKIVIWNWDDFVMEMWWVCTFFLVPYLNFPSNGYSTLWCMKKVKLKQITENLNAPKDAVFTRESIGWVKLPQHGCATQNGPKHDHATSTNSTQPVRQKWPSSRACRRRRPPSWRRWRAAAPPGGTTPPTPSGAIGWAGGPERWSTYLINQLTYQNRTSNNDVKT